MGEKSSAIRRARRDLLVIQAKRRARMADLAAADHVNCRALGFGVCDSIHRTTTSTGRPMPERGSGIVFEAAMWSGAIASGLMIVASIVF